MKKENLIKIQNLIIYFISASIVGWILEVLYAIFELHTFVNRGFLFGPWCPIYGTGTVIMVLIIEKLREKKISNIWMEILFIMLSFTVLEYFASYFLEFFFKLRWWDYTNNFVNLNGRICLGFSLTFGILGAIFIKYIFFPSKKLIEKVRNKITIKNMWIIFYIIILLFMIDTILSILRYI